MAQPCRGVIGAESKFIVHSHSGKHLPSGPQGPAGTPNGNGCESGEQTDHLCFYEAILDTVWRKAETWVWVSDNLQGKLVKVLSAAQALGTTDGLAPLPAACTEKERQRSLRVPKHSLESTHLGKTLEREPARTSGFDSCGRQAMSRLRMPMRF